MQQFDRRSLLYGKEVHHELRPWDDPGVG